MSPCAWFILSSSLLTIQCWSKISQPKWVDDVIDTPAVLEGDVFIGGLFHVFKTKEHVRCDTDLDMYSVMEMEAVKWSLMQLNQENFIPGVRLGKTHRHLAMYMLHVCDKNYPTLAAEL